MCIANSAEDTHAIGVRLGHQLKPGSVLAFYGDLGAGKTTLIRGLVEAVGGDAASHVSSPTFTYLNIYEGKPPVYHFDLYRLPKEQEFLAAGFDEYLFAGGICCIEWAEKIPNLLPKETICVHLNYLNAEQREITIQGRM